MMRLRSAEALFSLFIFAVGVGVVFYSARYGIIVRGRPGPGMFPLLAGVIMISAVSELLGKAVAAETEATPAGVYMRIGLIVAVMVGLVLVARPLGLLLASAVMMVAIGLICADDLRDRRYLARLAVVAVLFSIANHLFFSLFLRVPILAGPVDQWLAGR